MLDLMIEVMVLGMVFVLGIGGVVAAVGVLAWRLLKRKAE